MVGRGREPSHFSNTAANKTKYLLVCIPIVLSSPKRPPKSINRHGVPLRLFNTKRKSAKFSCYQFFFFFVPMAPTLYKTDASPPARAVLLTAAALGIELDQKVIDFTKHEQMTPEYRQVCMRQYSGSQKMQISKYSVVALI